AGVCYIVGNETTMPNVQIAPASGICVSAPSIFATYYLRGFTLAPGSGSCITVAGHGKLVFRRLRFEAAVAQISSTAGAVIEADGDYTIAGSATYHWLTGYGLIDVR